MDIQICQSCGIIIRGKSKFCTGCGATISKFSPTTLPVIAQSATPLAVALDPDPLVLERTMNKVQYAGTLTRSRYEFESDSRSSGNVEYGGTGGNGHSAGNGNGNGNGGGDGAAQTTTGGYSAYAVEPGEQDYSEHPGDSYDESPAAQASSKLQNILGGATGTRNNSVPAPADWDDADIEQRPPASAEFDQPPRPDGEFPENDDDYTPGGPSGFGDYPASSTNYSVNEEPDASSSYSPGPSQQSLQEQTRTGGFAAAAEETTVTSASMAPLVAGAAGIAATAAAAAFAGMGAEAPATVNQSTAVQPPVEPIREEVSSAPPAVAPVAAPPVANATQPPAPTQAQSPARSDFFGQSEASSSSSMMPENVSAPPMANTAAAVEQQSQAPPPSANPFETASAAPPAAVKSNEGPAPSSSDGPPPPATSGLPPAASPALSTNTSPFAVAPGGGMPPAAAASSMFPASAAPTSSSGTTSSSGGAPNAGAFNPGNSAAFSPGGAGQGMDFFSASGFGGTATTIPQTAESSTANSNTSPGATSSTEQKEEDDDLPFDLPEGTPSIVAQAIRAATSNNPKLVVDKTDESSKSAADAPAEDKPAEKKKRDDAPKRRSFSGKNDDSSSASKSSKKSSGKTAGSKSSKNGKAKRADDDDDDDDAPKDEPRVFEFGNIKIPMKMALIGIATCFGIPIIMAIIGALGSLVSPGGVGGVASLAGTWSFGVADTRGGRVNAQCWLFQNGNQITGKGVDKYGSFVIANGVYQFPQLQFAKVYVDGNNRPLTQKPIVYIGKIDWVNPEPGKGMYYIHMFGQWQLSKREGFGWRGHPVTYTGRWEAAMTQPETNKVGSAGGITGGPAFNTGGGGNPVANFFGFIFAFPQPGDPQGWPKFFARIAILLIILGLGLVGLSVKMFGPAGLLNIWSKKEYIPSQFKSQWGRMLREFGKPLKPGGLPLGTRADWNILNFYMPQKLNVPPEARTINPHILILGSGSKGKSRLACSMIAHDIESNDRAVVVIDSDGGMIDLLLGWMASHPQGAEMARRLIMIDPTHGSDSLAYNPLEFPDDGDLQNAASAVVFGFKAIYTEPPGSQSQWNQQTANILRNSAILLMANGKTLTDLPVLLSENDFRDVLLERVERMKNERPEYTTLLEAWAQYKRLARTDQWINWVEPILNRVQPMLGDPRIRPILTKAKGDLNLKEIMSEGKILFVKVPQGQLDQNASLLGSLLVTGLKQAALSLSLKASTRKHPCALYLDEMDNFIEKETYDAITSETRKFQIGFTGIAKSLQDLPEDYRNKIVSNVGMMCCFSLVKKDGDMLGPQMFRVDGRKVKHQTLQNIFNKVNTAPQFELISDEEKLNIDRVVGQEERTYFCYRVGTIAGVFQMKTPDFNDILDKDVNWTLIDQIYARSLPGD